MDAADFICVPDPGKGAVHAEGSLMKCFGRPLAHAESVNRVNGSSHRCPKPPEQQRQRINKSTPKNGLVGLKYTISSLSARSISRGQHQPRWESEHLIQVFPQGLERDTLRYAPLWEAVAVEGAAGDAAARPSLLTGSCRGSPWKQTAQPEPPLRKPLPRLPAPICTSDFTLVAGNDGGW